MSLWKIESNYVDFEKRATKHMHVSEFVPPLWEDVNQMDRGHRITDASHRITHGGKIKLVMTTVIVIEQFVH